MELLTEAIKLNPNSAAMFAKRGASFLKMKKPRACLRDCTRYLLTYIPEGQCIGSVLIETYADPDPPFYLNADPNLHSQGAIPMRTSADPCVSGSGSLSDFAVKKSWIVT